MVVISPHLDDAVFGCGEALAAHPGSIVVTVFAGYPDDVDQCTEWDARCGFDSAGQAVETRRAEDRQALAVVGATPVWLSFGDSQYGATPTSHAIAAALRDALTALPATTVLYPLGLFHSDHLLVHEACVEALADGPAHRAFAYEDALYRSMPGMLQRRLAALAAQRVRATPASVDAPQGHAARKATAVAAYASQLRAFGPDGYGDTRAPERRWRLEPDEGDGSLDGTTNGSDGHG